MMWFVCAHLLGTLRSEDSDSGENIDRLKSESVAVFPLNLHRDYSN